MNNRFIILLFGAFWNQCSFAAPQQLDITQYLTDTMKCNVEHYQPRPGEFDIDRFNAAWVVCKPSRDALLNALPEQVRPEWEAKLELIRTSMIDRFQPQPSQPGYGLNPENPVMIGGIDKGPGRTYTYFTKLRTSDGHPVQVHRVGSCCSFKTPNARIGDHALLDKYELTDTMSNTKIIVYVNIYDEGQIQAIKGFVLQDDV